MRDGVRIFLAFMITIAVVAVIALFMGFYLKSNKDKNETTATEGEVTRISEEVIHHTLTPTPSPVPTEEPEPIPDVKPVVTVTSSDTSSVSLAWAGFLEKYLVHYREQGSDIWYEKEVLGNQTVLTGLDAGKKYDLVIGRKAYIDREGWHSAEENATTALQFSDNTVIETAASGEGDPFKERYAILVVGASENPVCYTSKDGILTTKVWPQFDTKLYGDPELAEVSADVTAGTEMKVVMRGDKYCHLRENGFYSVYVSNGEGTVGWIDAEDLLVNLVTIFSPEESAYAMRFNRTNASSSLVTTGGAAFKIDSSSAAVTRFDILKDEESRYPDSGFNSVNGVTGYSLLKYGSKAQVPVVWGMAMELLTCQKNAMQRGCGLIVYEGYASKSACDIIAVSVRDYGCLDEYHGSGNLSNGFAATSFNTESYAPFNADYSKGIDIDVSLFNYDNTVQAGAELKMQTKMHTLDFRSNLSNNNENSDKLYDIMLNGTNLTYDDTRWWHFGLKKDTDLYPKLTKYIYGDYAV